MLKTKLGWVAAAARDGRLIRTTLPASGVHCAEASLQVKADFKSMHPLLAALREDLRSYFAGQKVSFSRYPVDLQGQPPFYRKALLAARRIRYGESWSYALLAAAAGSPRAARAVGQAMANNPLPLVIPCHRIVAAGGTLGGFGGGLALKRQLLSLEAVHLRDGGWRK